VCLVVSVGKDVAVANDGEEGEGGVLSRGDALEVVPVGFLGVAEGGREGGREGKGRGLG